MSLYSGSDSINTQTHHDVSMKSNFKFLFIICVCELYNQGPCILITEQHNGIDAWMKFLVFSHDWFCSQGFLLGRWTPQQSGSALIGTLWKGVTRPAIFDNLHWSIFDVSLQWHHMCVKVFQTLMFVQQLVWANNKRNHQRSHLSWHHYGSIGSRCEYFLCLS